MYLNTKKILLNCMGFCLMAFVFQATASAQGVGTITYTEGRVDILRKGSESAVPLREEEFVSPGDIIRTKSNSKAEISFYDRSKIQLAQNTRIEIKDYTLGKDNKRESAAIDVERGKIRTIVEKFSGVEDFKVTTPNAQGNIKGSEIFIFYQAGISGMLVDSGSLSVFNPALGEPPLVVPPGYSVVVPQGEAPKGPRKFLELEKKFDLQDTMVPPSVSERKNADVISGSITKVSGDVRVTKKGSESSHKAMVSEVIGENDIIETGKDGMVEIKFDNGNAISVKPESRIVIVKLVVDRKTKEFESLFELSMGKVKATVDKLTEGSSFRIKTPTAISGVRGTIMYVEALKTITKVFFEGGHGFLTSEISGDTQDVGMGENAFADDKGMVSTPVFTTQEQRMSIGEGWEPGSGIEGYSSPDGATGTYLYDTDTGLENIDAPEEDDVEDLTDTTDAKGQADEILDDPVPEPEPKPEPPVDDLSSLLGDFEAFFGYYNADDNSEYFDYGSINATIQLDAGIWESPQPLTLTGTFTLPGSPNEEYTELWASDPVRAEGDDGTVFLGGVEGINQNDELQAMLYSFYIRDDGAGGHLAGYVKSNDITGTFNSGSGEMQAAGTLSAFVDVPTIYAQEDLYDETPALNRDTISPFSIRGDISGNSSNDGKAYNLLDQNWGIFEMSMGGTYASTPSDSWEAVMVSTEDESFSLGVLIGDSWSDNKFSGIFGGGVINVYDLEMTSFTGDTLGTYQGTGSGEWQALSLGSFTVQDLAFGGSIDEHQGIYNPSTGLVDFTAGPGTINSFLFGVDDLNSIGSAFSVIGEYTGDYTQSLWAAADQFNVKGKTADNGAILGSLGEVYLSDNSILGLLYALYIRPDTSSPTGYSAGYIKSTDLAGEFIPEFNIFESEGTLTSYYETYYESPTTVTPEQLYDGSAALDQDTEPMIALFGGDTLSGQGEIIGETLISDQDRGITRISAGGTYSSIPSDPNDWHGVMGAADQDGSESNYMILYYYGHDWSEGKLSGMIINGWYINYDPDNPFHLGDLNMVGYNGDFIGTYGEGQWQSIGFVSRTPEIPLQFGGNFDTAFGDYTSISAIFGGTEDLFTGTPEVILMGEYNDAGNYDFWTYSDTIMGRTGNGAAFLGKLAGAKAYDGSNGLLYMMYIRPDGQGGYLAGYAKSTDLNGNVYSGINMLEEQGNLEQGSFEVATTVTPQQLLGGFVDNEFVEVGENNDSAPAIVAGDLEGTADGWGYNIIDQDWELTEFWASGTYNTIFSDNWHALIADKEQSEPNEISYMILDLDGYLGSNSQLKAAVRGRGIDLKTEGYEYYGYYLGSMWGFEGDFLGIYEGQANNWYGNGGAIDTLDEDLQFGGNFTGDFTGFDGSLGEFTPGSGNMSGILGGIDTLWSGSPGITMMGEFDNPESCFTWTDKEFFQGRTSDGAVFWGVVGGTTADNLLRGGLNALYIRAVGPEEYRAGRISSTDLAGQFYPDIGMFEAGGSISTSFDLSTIYSPNELYDGGLQVEEGEDTFATISHSDFTGEVSFESAHISDQDWGLWWGLSHGTYQTLPGPGELWNADVVGMPEIGENIFGGGSILGKMTGTEWSNHTMEANWNGIYISLEEDTGTLSGGTFSGYGMGTYVDVNEGATWEAANTGEWVEVNQLLNPQDLTNDIITLAENTQIPITEVYSNLLSAEGSGITYAAMDMHMYALDSFADDGIWAAIINGDYSDAPAEDWALTLQNGSDSATLSGPAWTDGQWTATSVTGTVNGSAIAGQAAGTYGDGAFEGAGVGTFEQQ